LQVTERSRERQLNQYCIWNVEYRLAPGGVVISLAILPAPGYL